MTLEESCESSVQGEGRDGRRKKYLSGDRSTDNLKAQKRPKNQGQKQHEERIRWNVQGQSLRRRRLKHGGEGGEEEHHKKERKNIHYLHGTSTELFIQLSTKDGRGPDFVLAGIQALPGDPFIIASLRSTQPIKDYFGRTTENSHGVTTSGAEALTTCR